MVNTEAILALIEQRGVKRRFIAQQMGISETRMHRLLNGWKWKLDEVVAFCRVMNLTRKQRDEFFLF